MGMTQEVALKDLRFFAPIGYYAEERLLGNEFYVDVRVRFPFDSPDAEALHNTLNYEELYEIVSEAMRAERKLLESAAKDILAEIRARFAFANEIVVSIKKTTPPFGSDTACSQVSLRMTN